MGREDDDPSQERSLAAPGGSHEARLSYPVLLRGFREHSALIAAARKSRNTALYDTAGTVSPSFVTEVTRVVSVLLEQVHDR